MRIQGGATSYVAIGLQILARSKMETRVPTFRSLRPAALGLSAGRCCACCAGRLPGSHALLACPEAPEAPAAAPTAAGAAQAAGAPPASPAAAAAGTAAAGWLPPAAAQKPGKGCPGEAGSEVWVELELGCSASGGLPRGAGERAAKSAGLWLRGGGWQSSSARCLGPCCCCCCCELLAGGTPAVPAPVSAADWAARWAAPPLPAPAPRTSTPSRERRRLLALGGGEARSATSSPTRCKAAAAVPRAPPWRGDGPGVSSSPPPATAARGLGGVAVCARCWACCCTAAAATACPPASRAAAAARASCRPSPSLPLPCSAAVSPGSR